MTVLNQKIRKYRPKEVKIKERTRVYPDTLVKGSAFVNEANDFEYTKVDMRLRCRVTQKALKK